MPHLAVIRDDWTSTQTLIVFNLSAKSSNDWASNSTRYYSENHKISRAPNGFYM